MTYLDSRIEKKIKIWVMREEKRLAQRLAKPHRPYGFKDSHSGLGHDRFI